MKFPFIPYAFFLCKRPRCQTLSNALEKSQNIKQLLPYFPMKLKYYYKFLITDALLNTWEENWIDIHISVYFAGVSYAHVCI